MAWFKVDDGFYTSHKVLMIPREQRAMAVGAWLLAGTWAADKMTDGVVPGYVLHDMGINGDPSRILCEVGLWHLTEDSSIVFHDWCDYQPTRQQLEAKSKARAEAGSLGGKRSAETRRSKSEANRSKSEANVNPEPEPEPEPLKPLTALEGAETKTGRKTRLMDSWYPDAELVKFSLELAPRLDVAFEVGRFIDYYRSQNRTSGDWSAAWRNWVRNQVKYDPSVALPLAPVKKIFRDEE
jgi:hypothetical protein